MEAKNPCYEILVARIPRDEASGHRTSTLPLYPGLKEIAHIFVATALKCAEFTECVVVT